MVEDYKEYLASRVITDGKPVSYRLLSRAITVNVNTAKQMLYEFYTSENKKKPSSIHATFLLCGRKHNIEETNGGAADGEDKVMQSSPYMSSMPDPESQEPTEAPVPTTSVVLIREEELESTKAQFDEITSIHVYSLEKGPLQDLTILSTCNEDITKQYAHDDPLERWRLYGAIHNPYIKRRTAKYQPAAAAKPATKAEPKLAAAKSTTESKPAPAKRASGSEEADSGRSTPQPGTSSSTSKKTDSRTTAKKEKPDIFGMFAKGKAKLKAPAKPKESTPTPAEDEPMQGMSEDEGVEEDVPEVKFDEEKASQARKARTEREEKLRKMMEESDDEMPDVTPAEESQQASKEATPAAQPEPEPTVTVQGGRRRGRRRVMKKRMVKDEEGYLVTKEEPAWESFSEDEPEPKKIKPTPKPASTAKKPAKTGQGNIASFFKKK